MKPKTSVKNPSTAAAREHSITGSVTSQDGTTIGYHQLGHGPGVVLPHSAMRMVAKMNQIGNKMFRKESL